MCGGLSLRRLSRLPMIGSAGRWGGPPGPFDEPVSFTSSNKANRTTKNTKINKIEAMVKATDKEIMIQCKILKKKILGQ